jgi:Ca-activated chloride channel family protein
MLSRNIIGCAVFIGLSFTTQGLAAEDPDELYRQGRFAEAEKAYSQYDMDHPEDIRYRYNRGCATYRNSDYEGAAAAFSSVLRRAKDDTIRFKAAYNSGNTAIKQGDFESAVAYYKQAIRYNFQSEDTRHNLELALIGLENSKKEKAGKPKSRHQKEQPQSGKKEEGSNKPSVKKDSDREQSQSRDQGKKEGHRESDRETAPKPDQDAGADEGQRAEQESSGGFSGEPESLQALPQEQGKEKSAGAAMSIIDKKMAEALLDNIKENRSRFLRFQVPKDKRNGVPSGKDW